MVSTQGDKEATMAGDKSLSPVDKEKGGFRAAAFIFALASLENMGFIAIMVSLVLYFISVMHFHPSGAANTVTNFLGTTFLLSLVGGFISDTFLTRFHTVLVFGAVDLVALIMVIIQAYSNKLHPDDCGKSSCVEGGIAVMLYTSLCLLALGSGGVRGALPAHGADQFNDRKDPNEVKALATFFNWLTLSITLGAMVGVTVIVWISTNKGWHWGFFTSMMSAFIGFVVFALGKPFFRIQAPGDSPFIRITQVIVAAIRNRNLSLPENPDQLYEISEKEAISTGEKIPHTNQFRFLDKAAILCEGSKPQPGKVCTVTQVEEVKILTRMMPIIGSTIIMNTCLAQLQTFSVQQGNIMDPHLGSLKVPAPSIPVIPLIFMNILLPLYELVFVPFVRKFTHHPTGITQLQRVGIGLVLSVISMAIAGVVEVKRKNQSNKRIKISLFWLSYQYGIFGIADMFTLVGMMEFFYKEAPVGMKSLSTSFTWLSLSFGYFLSSIFVNLINAVTKRIAPSKQGWLEGELLDKNNLNLFYWFLAILSCLNFANYLYWASWYKYKIEDSEPEPESIPKAPSKGSPFLKQERTQDDGAERRNETSKEEISTQDDGEKRNGTSDPNTTDDAREKNGTSSPNTADDAKEK